MLALGFGNSTIQVNSLASDELKALKPAKELEQLDNDNDEFFEEMYRVKKRQHQLNFWVTMLLFIRFHFLVSDDCFLQVIYRTASPVWQAQFCNRDTIFAASTADQTVSLWATDKNSAIRIFSDAMADVTCLDFHPNCNYIVGGSDDRYVRVWDVLTGTCVRTFSGHKGAVKSVKVSPCGRYLVSASSEGQIAVWDMAQQKLLGTQTCEPMDYNSPIVFSRDASTMTGCGGGSSTTDVTNEPRIDPAGFAISFIPYKENINFGLLFHS
uniref:Uncharacterized protein n=1 Tax=Ditylenchus dipsaci TaxID=166011 RepID=A0A915E6M5_9BILA